MDMVFITSAVAFIVMAIFLYLLFEYAFGRKVCGTVKSIEVAGADQCSVKIYFRYWFKYRVVAFSIPRNYLCETVLAVGSETVLFLCKDRVYSSAFDTQVEGYFISKAVTFMLVTLFLCLVSYVVAVVMKFVPLGIFT